jgi:predicted MPP superfamily phosphohydrolase
MHFPFIEVALSPGNFADTLKGLRVIQLCDLHISKKTDPAYLHQLISKVNEKSPDIVVFTGDIIKDFAFKLRIQLAALKGLHAPAFYVSGNHDFFFGLRTLRRELALSSISCIDNACAHLIINDTPLQIAGLSNRSVRNKKEKRPVKELFSSLDEAISTILLAHQPNDIEFCKDYRIDIQFSAHTHNADAYPFHALLKKYQPYYKGLYTKGRTLLYVSSGLNTSPFQLKRHTLAEIPVFTIL